MLYFKVKSSLSELVGIILGDGHLKYDLFKRKYSIGISLNEIDDPKYVKYVESLMLSIFKVKPSLVHSKKSKKINLEIYRKQIVEALISIGLVPGNKVKNQVSVPEWIKKDISWIINNQILWENEYKLLVISCLKGLIDTDGTIYPIIKENAIKIGFKNASFPLINDFKEMCESLNIRTSEIIPYIDISDSNKKEYTYFNVLIQARDQVKKFLKTINPMKWQYKADKLMNLVNKPFDYRMNYYKISDALHWKELYEKIGDFRGVKEFIKNQKKSPPKVDTIRRNIEEILGKKNYLKWLRYNSNIHITETLKLTLREYELKKILCYYIYKILKDNSFSIEETHVLKALENRINTESIKIFNNGKKYSFLLFGRLSSLLNQSNSKNLLTNYLKRLIQLVVKIIEFPSKSHSIIRKELNLSFSQDHLIKLINDVKNCMR